MKSDRPNRFRLRAVCSLACAASALLAITASAQVGEIYPAPHSVQFYIIAPPIEIYESRSVRRQADAEDPMEHYTYYERADGPVYFFDIVNRRPSLTPEPIWRTTFAGIRDRIAAEIRAFDVPGQAARERAYHRSFYYRDADK